MIKLLDIKEEDYNTLNMIFNYHYNNFGNYAGKFFKYSYNNEEKYLYQEEQLYIIYSINNGIVSHNSFYIDNNNKVSYFDYSKYSIKIENKNLYFFEEDGKINHGINIVQREKNELDINGYNSLIVYTQYNSEINESIVLCYQYMYNARRDKNNIYDFHIKEPLQIVFGKGINFKHKKKYILVEAEKGTIAYNIMNAKDKNSNYQELTKKRYYRNLYINNDKLAITSFPLGKQYSYEDMVTILQNKGFYPKLPTDIQNIFNNINDIIAEYQELANTINYLEYESEEEQESVFNLKLEKSDSNV